MKKGVVKMKMNKKMIILFSTLVLSIICVVAAKNLSYSATNKKESVKVAKIANAKNKDYNSLALDKCYVLKVNTEFKYIEIQTWDFEYITINFLESSMDQVNFSKGDVINLYNVKKKVINKNNFYFADKDTKIDMYLKNAVNKSNITKSSIKESVKESVKENNYNYGDAN